MLMVTDSGRKPIQSDAQKGSFYRSSDSLSFRLVSAPWLLGYML
jgi:hypothetical protein